MKANNLNSDAINFFKNNGLLESKEIIKMSAHALVDCGDGAYFHINQLKRLVESHELVMDYYGLTRAKEHAESNYTAPELKDALKQAISDVESCQ